MRLQEWLILLAVIGVVAVGFLVDFPSPLRPVDRPPAQAPEPQRWQYPTIGDYCRAKTAVFEWNLRARTGYDLGEDVRQKLVHGCMTEEVEAGPTRAPGH